MSAPETPMEAAPAADRLAAQRMAAWRRRSHRVHALRRWLPRAAVALVVFTGMWMLVRSLAAILVAADFQGGQVRMLNPHFLGRDQNGRAYGVTAKEAVRDAAHPDRATLVEPRLVLHGQNPRPTTAIARAGALDQTRHQLLLAQDVQVDDGGGYHFTSEQAQVDTETGAVEGRSSVVGTGPLGRITASAYAISPHGDRISFSGGVRSHVIQH